MKQEILDLTYELVDEIKATKDYQRLLELKGFLDKDEAIIELIHAFNKIKAKYEEVNKYGKYHPDLKKVGKELSEIKEKVFENEIIKEYKDLEKKIQKQLDEISRKIATSVSSKIKHPNEIGLIKKH